MKQLISVIVISLMVAFPAVAAEKINATCTIGQITDIVQNIGGTRVSAQGLMGAGVDPHLYRASESDVRKLSGADIIFYNGLHLEAKMTEIFERLSRTKTVVAVSRQIPHEQLLSDPNFPDVHDPHIWFDVSFWISASETVRDALIAFDPQGKDVYAANTESYLKQLRQLDEYLRQRAAELAADKRILVTAHDAFRYFGRAYGFEVVGLQGISTDTEAGTRDVMALADMIAKRKIKAIFIESSVPQRNIQAVQEAVKARGWSVVIGGELFSDALGSSGTKEGTYVGMVEHNINTIVDALK